LDNVRFTSMMLTLEMGLEQPGSNQQTLRRFAEQALNYYLTDADPMTIVDLVPLFTWAICQVSFDALRAPRRESAACLWTYKSYGERTPRNNQLAFLPTAFHFLHL
jgi:hypothetical protein